MCCSCRVDYIWYGSKTAWGGRLSTDRAEDRVMGALSYVVDSPESMTVCLGVFAMSGGGCRGSFRGRHSFGGRPPSAGRSSGRSRSWRSSRRLGSSRSSRDRVVTYSIYNSRGKRIYVGSTNNPGRRTAQHAKDGRLPRGGQMVVESGPMSRRAAQQLEARKLQGYRRRTGRLPRYNRTSDGQYHHKSSSP